MILSTVSLKTLADRALREARNQHEVGRPVVRPASLDTSVNVFKLAAPVKANVTDVLEFDSELMLVTQVSADSDPDYTVIRGHFGTTPIAHPANEPGLLNPTFTRRAAKDGVLYSIPAIESVKGLELLKAVSLTPILDPGETFEDLFVLEVPAEAREVWHVRYGLLEVPRAPFIEDLPNPPYTTGQVVKLPMGIPTDRDLLVTFEAPYRWSSWPLEPDEDDTIELPADAEFLPSSYAVAYMLGGREYSRTQLDRSEEWNQTAPMQTGLSRSIVRDAWQAFYRKLDEARRLDTPLPRRPIVVRPSDGWGTI